MPQDSDYSRELIASCRETVARTRALLAEIEAENGAIISATRKQIARSWELLRRTADLAGTKPREPTRHRTAA